MRELRLVGPGEDGASLVVEAINAGTPEGERFTLALDERLRTLTTESPEQQPEPAPVESKGPTPSPREIQVRVRSGESAEGLAADAGIPLERVMRFALPVLQERHRVTDEARRARARRGGDGQLVPFGELVDARLARHNVDPTATRWDAFRREDGGWTVTSRFRSYERDVQAKFSFALANRTVSALDDIAADLLSDRPVAALLPPPPVVEPEPIAESTDGDWAPDWPGGAPPRLTAVPNPGRAETVRAQEASPAVRPPSRRQKAHTRPVAIDSDDELFDQDAYAQQPWHEPPLPFEAGVSTRSAGPRHRAPRGGDGRGTEPVRLARTGAGPADARPAEPVSLARTDRDAEIGAGEVDAAPDGFEPPPGFGPEPAGAGAEPAEHADQLDLPTDPASDGPGSSGRRGRRTGDKPRMPSWDDILLGVRHKSD